MMLYSLIDIAILAFIIISACGILNIIFEFIAIKKKSAAAPLYIQFLNKAYNNLFFPFAFLSIFLAGIKIVKTEPEEREYTLLIVLSVFILISLACEIIRFFYIKNHLNLRNTESGSGYKSVFTAISNYYNKKSENRDILIQIENEIKQFLDKINNFQSITGAAYRGINAYINLQREECSALLENKNLCLSLFGEMENNSRQLNDLFIEFMEKINSSLASVKYFANSNVLLNDINSSFQQEYRQQSEFINKETENIVNEINNVSYKCGQFTKLFSLYDEIIQSYSGRLETSLEYRPEYFVSEKGEKLSLSDVIYNITGSREIGKEYLKKTKGEQLLNKIKADNYALDNVNAIINKKDNEIKKLKKQNEENDVLINETKYNYDKEYKKKKVFVSWLIVTVIISIITISVVGSLLTKSEKERNELILQSNAMIQNNNRLKEQNEKLTADNKMFNEEKNTINKKAASLQTQIDDYIKIMNAMERKVDVINIKLGNYGNGNWITKPGGDIYNSNTYTLRPQITINSIYNGNVKFYTRIRLPYSTFSAYSESVHSVSRGINKAIDLNVYWGRSYYSGYCTVEVYNSNYVLLCSRDIYLY